MRHNRVRGFGEVGEYIANWTESFEEMKVKEKREGTVYMRGPLEVTSLLNKFIKKIGRYSDVNSERGLEVISIQCEFLKKINDYADEIL